MVSQKISSFNVSTTLNDSDLFTFVVNGTNKNIAYSSFKTDLGVTGTLSQTGNALAAPVLDQVGSDYNIRSIEGGAGINTSVSAENGINVACNFTQGSSGLPLITSLKSSQYEFKTLVAGNNMAIADNGDHLTIGFNPSSGSSKTVVVSSISDFPEPITGVITLAAETDYLIVDDISTVNRFVVSVPNSIRASTSQMVTLEYTGSGDMFTGVNPNFKIANITVAAPNGHILNTTSPLGTGIVQMVESNIGACQTIGSIDGNFITRFSSIAFESIALGGLTFSGANNILVIDVGVAFLGGGSLIDLGTATFNTVSITGGNIADSSVGAFFLSGATLSANINVGGLGSVINNNEFGSGTSLQGISTNDARWNFLANNNIPDTRPDGLLSFDAPTTSVLTAATPALITGAWTIERVSQMSGTVVGRLTYDGEKNSTLPITVTLSLEPVAGTNKDINIYLAKNGTVISNSKAITTVSAGSPKNQSVLWQDAFAGGDYYEIWIESVDGTDVQVNTAKLRVN